MKLFDEDGVNVKAKYNIQLGNKKEFIPFISELCVVLVAPFISVLGVLVADK